MMGEATSRSTQGRAAHVAATIVILLAGGLSAAWAFIVPIFQAPDEPAHFDYAMSIYSAGHLVRASRGPVDWIVSPYTKYLLRASDFERIAWRSSMRVPFGYGTSVYFSHLNAGAPNLKRPPIENGHVNYIVPSYPFGFYALEASWIKLASIFTGSLTVAFFWGRLLCVFLMMFGLYCNYRTAIRLGIPPWLTVGAVASLGLLPLTTFVSSYIQPDNLVYALVSATLFFASGLSNGDVRARTAIALGLCLGLLSITKYQFFISVSLPTYVLVSAVLWRRQSRAASVWIWTIAILSPTLALLAVQHWVDDAAHQLAHPVLDAGYLSGEFAMGLMRGVEYITTVTSQAFANCFISGLCAATYWQVFGWFDTPIVIVNWTVESAIRVAISLVSVATAVVLLVSCVKNGLRLLALALRGRARAGLFVFARDPMFNSYLCFLGVMLMLYVLTNNQFGAEGRQLYPFAFAGVLCVVWYAPRVLSKKTHTLSSILTAVMVVYSVVAASFGTVDVVHRYYGPQVAKYVVVPWSIHRMTRGESAGTLRPLETTDYKVETLDFRDSFSLADKVRLRISGTALFPSRDSAAASVAVVVDSRFQVPVLTEQYDLPIAEGSRRRSYAYSDFYAYLATAQSDEGVHTVSAYAQVPGDIRFEKIEPRRVFFLTGDGERFSAEFLQKLRGSTTVEGRITKISLCKGRLSEKRGVPAVAGGSVALVSGWVETVDAEPLVWFLVDGKPYPARFADERFEPVAPLATLRPHVTSFVGTIPTRRIGPGIHAIRAFTMSHGLRGLGAIAGAVKFSVSPERGEPRLGAMLPDASKYCFDPLRILQGTFP
jgi:hypothetical protein